MENILYRNKESPPVSNKAAVDNILEEMGTQKIHPLSKMPISGAGPSEPEEPKTEPKEHMPKKKGLLWDMVFYVALIILVFGVLLAKSGGDGAPVSVLGFSMHNVLTSSMQSEIPKGSLVITRWIDPASLQIGDDITYLKDSATTVTHRIVGIIEDYAETGQRAFETQGVMNKERDKLPAPAANVVGKVIFHNLALGEVMSFLSQWWHFALLFMLLFAGLGWAVKSWREVQKEAAGEPDAGPKGQQNKIKQKG